jgi:hypothetical protein
MTKATHKGECQICGRQQKLPGGLLSLHGYTKRWNWFEGTCPGARCQPFEKSYSEITLRVDWSEGRIGILQEEVVEQKAGTGPLIFEQYVSATWTVKSHYLSTRVKLVDDEVQDLKGNKVASRLQHSLQGDSGEQKLRDRRVAKLERDIKKHREYIAWQQERIDNWVERDLTPVEVTT